MTEFDTASTNNSLVAHPFERMLGKSSGEFTIDSEIMFAWYLSVTSAGTATSSH